MSSNGKKFGSSSSQKKGRKSVRKSIKTPVFGKKDLRKSLGITSEDEDSFVAMERSILNSCRKNKEALFDKDSQQVGETPRRETYIVDTPMTSGKGNNNSFVAASASPELLKKSDESYLNVTLNRGSEKKDSKSKRKVSFVTPLRRSTRISVATPLYNSVKDRPKTPMPSRLSSTKKRVSFMTQRNDSGNLNLNVSGTSNSRKSSVGKAKRPSTPMPLSKQKQRKMSSVGNSYELAYKKCIESTPKVVLHRLKEEDLSEFFTKSKTATPSVKPDIKVIKEDDSLEPKTATPCPKPDIKVIKENDSLESKTATPSVKPEIKIIGAKTPRSPPDQKKVTSTPFQSSAKKGAALAPGFKLFPTPGNSTLYTPQNARGKKTPLPPSSTRATPGFKRFGTPIPSSTKRSSPRSVVKSTPNLTASAVKKTPNFNKLHQRAFEKMESLSDYKKRKIQNSLKKAEEQEKYHVPTKSNNIKKSAVGKKGQKKGSKVFGGIPFVPTQASTKPMKAMLKGRSELKAKATLTLTSKSFNESAVKEKTIQKSVAKRAILDNIKAIKSASVENTPLKQRHRFDLRASLAKKLTYKPHTGPLKPLNESNLNNTLSATTPLPPAKKFETENKVIKASRIKSREVLQGVRKNKRFLLQMKNRKSIQ